MEDLPSNSRLQENPCSECGKKTVVLFLDPDEHAGIYSCELAGGCGASWSCEHEDYETETIEVDIFEPVHGHDTREELIAVCTNCGVDCTEDHLDDMYDPGDDS